MSKLSLTLLAVLALPAFAEGPAPKPAEGAPAPAPKSGAATTATPKGQGVKKVKPATTTPSTTGQKAAETTKAQ